MTSDAKPSFAVRQVTVGEASDGQRIDNFLVRELKGVPKSRIYRLLRKGEIRVNKGRVKPEFRLNSGDVVRIPPIRLGESEEAPPVSAGLAGHLEAAILYEDEGLLVVNKPSGLAVHGGSGVSLGLIEALRQLRPEAKFLELVHRLDRETSGCIMIAKKRSVLKALHELLREGRMQKTYLALVAGRWPARKREVRLPLKKNVLSSGERMVRVDPEGKPAVTQYQVLRTLPEATLVAASPVTGRTHQIRVHCKAAGHPIVGDEKYGEDGVNQHFRSLGLRRLFLHASRLQLELDGRRIEVDAPLDRDLQLFLERFGN